MTIEGFDMDRGTESRHGMAMFQTISRLGNNFESYSTGNIETGKEEAREKGENGRISKPGVGGGE